MKPAKAFILAGIACALALAIFCFASDVLFDGFDGVAGQHVSGWSDATNPGESFASADFIYADPSLGNIVTLAESAGYGEIYQQDFITVDTSTYPYLNVKIDTVTNTSTAWQIFVGTSSNGTWQGFNGATPMANPTTATGYFSFPMTTVFPSLGSQTFVLGFTVTGVQDLEENYYGYDGDTVGVDYVRMSTTDEEEATPTPAGTATPTPNPTATPTPVPKRGGNGGFTSSSAHSFFGWMRELFGY